MKSRLVRLLLLPWWALQLPTQAKSFSRNPLIGSRRLNRCGLHVARMVVAHGIMRLRMALLGIGLDADVRRAWHRDGFIVVPDVFDAVTVGRLQAEVRGADAEVRECVQGDTLTHRIQLDSTTLPTLPTCRRVLDDTRFRGLLRFASGELTRPIAYIQTIKNGHVDGPVDPQKHLHSDTFHPTMKSWYFLDDVDERNGPFTYVPGSHRLTLARLRWEYAKSIEISGGADRYSGNGSLRLSEADAREMGFPAPKAFAVPRNTLVIANTHGFHCRGQASERSTRTELWSIGRSNPFNPFPGLDIPALDALQHRALAWWRRRMDRQAEARGLRSSWHVVAARSTLELAPEAADGTSASAGESVRSDSKAA